MKNFLPPVFLLAICLGLPGRTAAAENTAPVIRQPLRLMTQDYADFRKAQISNVSYDLDISVDENTDIFTGKVSIRFDVSENNISPVTLDFDQGDILSLAINGQPATWLYERWYITIPADQLATGGNTLVIEYQRPYTTDGDGLHKFTDPENGEIYLYTNFEPYNANRFFPLFDQPNLKAAFTLTAHVPANWQVISNMREADAVPDGDNRVWHFPATPPISTYLFAFHAGPFSVWEDRSGNIDLRLFARSSLADYVDTEEWFTPTRQFLPFYQDYFDVPYPLEKYDQIIVPDFNAGAMENIGAVTFNEAYISRGEKSIREKSRLAYVIAHEMAHMWFGDQVTMNWWNDLWLNESFATYMGYLALERASVYTDAWDIFYSRDKANAYRADSRVTTHPVALSAATTSDAVANFDTITYQKGSSVLKQLPYYIGEANFRRGVSNYLKSHRFGNATLDDFVAALEDSSGMDLSQWQYDWLQTSGANTLKTEFSCADGTVTGMRLVQSVPETSTADKVLRSQRTQVGLYRYTDNEMVLGSALPVSYRGVVTWIPEAIGEPCPDMVFPNLDDQAYMVIELDDVSRNTLLEHINDFSDTTTRLMLWESLWTSVRDARMSLDEFLTFAFASIAQETVANVVRQVSGNMASAFGYYSAFGGHDDKRLAIQNFAWRALNDAAPGSEIQKIWYGLFSNTAHTDDALDALLSLLRGDLTITGLDIDQDKRWDIVITMNRYLYGDYDDLLTTESQRDISDLGVNSVLAAHATRPDPAVKKDFLDTIINDHDRYKLASLRYITRSLYPGEQLPLSEPDAGRILAVIPDLNANADEGFLDEFLVLLPATCTPASVARLEQASTDFATFQPLVTRAVLVSLQEDRRCVRLKGLIE